MLNKILKHKNLIFLAVSSFFGVSAVALVIYYIIAPSAAYFHSDCSDTILWAQASYDSGALFSETFNYAALLPFGGTAIMTPLIGIFGVSMTTHQIGMVIFTLIFFASLFLLCKTADFGNKLSFAAVGVTALTLCSSEKLREIFYEHVIYYSICVAVIYLLLALFMRFPKIFEENAKKSKTAVLCIIIYAVTFLAAFNGMQIIATGIFPVLFAVAAHMLLSKEKLFCRKNFPSIYFVILCVFSMLIGMAALNASTANVTAGYANAYSTYSAMDEWLKNLSYVVKHWFDLFGVTISHGMPIFTLDSILNILRIGASLVIAIVPIVALCVYNKFDKNSQLIILTHFGLTAVIMFGYIFGILSAANWRLSPMICTGILVCAVTFKLAVPHMVPRRIAATLGAVLILMSALSFKTVTDMPVYGKAYNEKYALTEYLKENGYEYGFATFWNSNPITVLSDSEVTVRSITVDENGIAPYYYQSDASWFNAQQGIEKYFVILTDAERNTLSQTADWLYFENISSEYEMFNGYHIYTFGSLYFLN